MTSKMLLEQYMAERHALGFSLKTDEGCIRRFLQDFAEPDDGEISFTKEYVLDHIGNRRNLQTNTILRDVSAINGFLDFVIRKGYTAYKIPPKSLPKENRNFRAYIFTDDEIERMLTAADHVPFTEQNPARKYQIPVMFRILFNCGLRTSGNVKKCAVGKHPKSEKHGNTAQFSEVERSGTQENCGGIGSGCRLRLRPLPVLRRRQSQRVARIDPNAVVVDKNIAENDRFDLFSR